MGIGRLRDGVSPEQAESEARVIIERVASEQPRLPGLHRETRVISVREDRVGPFRPALLLLAVASGLVLLMTCANVAGLLLARGIVRQRELAVRGALGAGRGRIVRQLLIESVALSMTAGTIGVAVAFGIVRAAPALTPGYVPRLAEVGIDGGVLAFTATVSVVAGLLFGTAPALAWSRVDLARTLNDAAAASAGGFGRLGANRWQAVLVVAQVALALVLLTGAGLLLRSFVSLVTHDSGFEGANVVVAEIADPADSARVAEPYRLADVEARDARARRASAAFLARLERTADLPGVDAVALSSSRLLNLTGAVWPFEVAPGSATSDPGREVSAFIRNVTPDYADVVRLRLRAGRFFTGGDREGAPRVAVVSESLARNAFGGESAVGQRLMSVSPVSRFRGRRDGRGDGESGPLEWEVIGVVADIRPPFGQEPVGLYEGDIYLSMLQPGLDDIRTAGRAPRVVVRTDGDPLVVVPFIQEAVADPPPSACAAAEGRLTECGWSRPAGGRRR